MRQQIKLKTLQAIIASVFCFSASSVFATSYSVGYGSTTSGGSSSGSSVSGCVSIGDSTSGGSYGVGYASYSGAGASDCAGQDSDGDHMKDTWETTYSLNKYLATDAYGDVDGDGSSNQREAAMGSKPSGAGTACPGFSTTTTTDADCDGVTDGDDPAPTNPAITTLTVNGTYKGEELGRTDTSN